MNSASLHMPASAVTETTTCYHCGDDCDGFELYLNSKSFCCNGCKTIYEILSSEGMNTYYTLESAPGIKVENGNLEQQYAYLDKEEILTQLLDFKSAAMSKVTLFIPQIHCSSCIWLLENLHKLNSNIQQSEVNFGKKQLAVTFGNNISLKDLVLLLCSLGYEPSISLADKKAEKKESKALFYKLGVAGFCFGNIMLLSFPEYLGVSESGYETYKNLFLYLSVALSLPVVFYCSSDYLANAYNGLVNKHVSIDVPISLGILVLFSRSVFEIFAEVGSGYLDSLAGLIFFLLIGKWYQSKIYKSLAFNRDYESYFPIAVTKLNNEKEEIIQLKDLKVGNQILLRNQELIPADAKLISGTANIDYSFVTGESETSKKDVGDHLYAGGRQIGSNIVIEIQKKVNQSYLTQLWNQDAFTKEQSKYTTIIDTVGKYFTGVILTVTAFAAIYWNIADSSQLFNVVCSILIIACPCALALTVPFTLGSVMRIFGKQGLYVKNVETIEKMASINTIVFDKTGTITNSSKVNVDFIGEPLSQQEIGLIKTVVKNSTHPLSRSIDNALQANKSLLAVNFKETVGKGIEANVNGNSIKLGSNTFFGITDLNDSKSKVYLSINKSLKGYFEFENSFRKGFHNLFFQLKEKFGLHLLSGDGNRDYGKFSKYFDTDKLHFSKTPVTKLNYINELQNKKQNVLMIGDGLNDAGALKQSNVGIAVSDNIHNFSPACDAILASDNFSKTSSFLSFSRLSMKLVKLGFILSFLYNIVGVSLAVSNLITPLISAILMPLSSVSIVLFGTLSSRILANKYFKQWN